MATVEILQGMSIGDAVLNSTGDISNWGAFLNKNFFDSWVPNLFNGQILEVPDSANVNVGNIAALAEYPANNFSVPDIYNQIDALFASLVGLTPIPSVNVIPILDTNVYYVCRPLETVGDSILNGSGDINNWNAISAANFWDTWTPILFAGEKVAIPTTSNQNSNNYRALNTYPANNFSVPDIYNQIDALFASMDLTDRWILRFGYWLDSNNIVGDSLWEDADHWIDG